MPRVHTLIQSQQWFVPKGLFPRVISHPRKVPTIVLLFTCQTADMQTAGRRTIRSRTINLRPGKLPTRRNSLSSLPAGGLLLLPDYGGNPIHKLEVLPPNPGLCRLLGDLSSRSHNLTFLRIITRYSSSTRLNYPSSHLIHHYFYSK